MIELRRRLMRLMASGGNAKKVTGTFTGDGDSSSVSLNIGFEPDVVFISCGYDATNYATAGWTGCAFVCIFKDDCSLIIRHATNTSTSAGMVLNAFMGGTYGAFGNLSDAPAASVYGEYSNGVLNIINKSPNQSSVKFIANETYTWTAYAAI